MFYFFSILFFISSNLFASHSPEPSQKKILVSILPQKYIVQRIVGDTIPIEVFVPESFSPHVYEPKPSQIQSVRNSQIWFRIGEPFERHLLKACKKNTVIIDQREGLPLLSCGCHHDKDAYDPHIWLSPHLVQVQATKITEILSALFPSQALFFHENLKIFLEELTSLDQEISLLLSPIKNRNILVAHPAFGYFCKDYGLNQLSIEISGKDPSPKQITLLLQQAQEAKISCVYLIPQYSLKGGKKIAKELKAHTALIDPYAEDIVHNLKTIAAIFEANQ